MESRSMLVAAALIATSSLLGTATSAAQTPSDSKATAQLRQESITPDTASRSEVTNASLGGGATTTAPAPAKPIILARGSTLLAELSNTLNVRKLKPGDKIKASLAQDLVLGGKLVAKTESKVLGHVTEAKSHSAESPESRLGIVFDKILLKHHQELDFEGVIQAVAPPAPRVSRVDMPDQMMPPPVMSISSSTPNPPRGSSSSSASSNRNTSSTTTLATSGALGQVAVVASTPGMNPGGTLTHASVAGNHQISGGVGMHGIYGLKGLSLSPSMTETNPGPVIACEKGDVKLDSGTQLVLLVNK